MSNNVVGTSLLADLGRLLADFFEKVAGPEGAMWLEAFKRFLKKERCWGDLLQLVTTVSVSAHYRFVMKDHLQSANIGWTGDSFKGLFLKKGEENVPARKINVNRLKTSSRDPEIMAEIGPEKRMTFLAHFTEMIEKQSNGQPGDLKTDGSANVAYIPDDEGNLWAVNANWNSNYRYWNVEANSVENPNEWNAGNQFFSKISLFKNSLMEFLFVSANRQEFYLSHLFFLTEQCIFCCLKL